MSLETNSWFQFYIDYPMALACKSDLRVLNTKSHKKKMKLIKNFKGHCFFFYLRHSNNLWLLCILWLEHKKIRWKSQVNDKVSFKNECGQIYTIYFYA